MSDATMNAVIQVIGLLIAVFGYLSMRKRHETVLLEQKNQNDKALAETRRVNALEVEEQRHRNQMTENENFRKEINDLKVGILKMKQIMETASKEIAGVVEQFKETSRKTEEYLDKFEDFKHWSFTQFGVIHAKHTEYDANFGKVIVK